MKAVMLRKKTEIDNLPKKTEAVHFIYRPSVLDILNLKERCHGLKKISIPPGIRKTLPRFANEMLAKMEVEIVEQSHHGWRSDKHGNEVDIDIL